MDRNLKKAFAAVVLGIAGAYGGLHTYLGVATDHINKSLEECSQTFDSKPCDDVMNKALASFVGSGLAGGAIGAAAGLVLVGRKRKADSSLG